MKILVVTPTLGESPWLAETVMNVAAFPQACEHVLVAPATAVAVLAVRYPRAKVVAETGGGMYASINRGLAAVSDWDAFTYINDDDLLLPGFSAAVAALRANPGRPMFAYGRVRLVNGESRRLGAIAVSPWPQLNRLLYAQRIEPVYQHGTLVGRLAWERCGGFDPGFRFCGDSEYLARLCVRGLPAVYVNSEVAAFRLRPGQLTQNRPTMTAERARVDEQLGLLAPTLTARHRWARVMFRLANLPVYAERIARHGFITFDELIVRAGGVDTPQS